MVLVSKTRKSARRKRGRPALPEDERRKLFGLNLTAAERAWVEQRASEKGELPTVWARKRVLRGYREGN